MSMEVEIGLEVAKRSKPNDFFFFFKTCFAKIVKNAAKKTFRLGPFFCCTSLPLASTRCVRASVYFPLTIAVDQSQQHQK